MSLRSPGPSARTLIPRSSPVRLLASQLGFTALHLAIKSENPALANKLADMEGIDLNAKTRRGFTPMMVAAWKGDFEVVNKLICKGASMTELDTAGRNVWGVANDWHKEEILELLKRHDVHMKEGDVLAFPPHPKWRPDTRETL